MPPETDSARAAETGEWFAKARFDLRCAGMGLQVSPPLIEDVLFHCQQAAERAMKGFPTWYSVAFTRTHDLRRLVDSRVAVDSALEAVLAGAAPLSEFAWRFRYPGEPLVPSLDEGIEASRIARTAVDKLASGISIES